MQLEAVYVRFFRSLNYDYLRKSDPGYEPAPWDRTPDGTNYPFVRVRLEPDITTIVGANESGKSQLLEAIKLGLTGDSIERGDFCRYSAFFSNDNNLTLPEFGVRFPVSSDDERVTIAAMCELDEAPMVTRAALFRMNQTPRVRLYLQGEDGWAMHHVKKPRLLRDLGLPAYFEIDADVPLPDSVPIEYLVTGNLPSAKSTAGLQRHFDRLAEKAEAWFASADALRSSADEVMAVLEDAGGLDEATRKKYQLADDLLTKVVGLDRELFSELSSAVSGKRNGYANSIVDKINDELAKSLNFPHWWSQDSAFKLVVDLRRDELVFVIHDRTGTSYSFDERSAGLKYFLSYFVQHLSHESPEDGRSELLLMDEPDAFLSSSGQQDLMRIFTAFAHPEHERPPVQVIYVTHSPFLIDKNHAQRIRVLEKGEHDEGTRVVANASRNHYEPLRSALGSFVGETAFIGTCNLLLEGPSDQVLIAGVSSWLARADASATQRLDLNTITLVPAGSASHIPYVAFLARGRDIDRPPVIVLLDGDPEGDKARAALAKGGPRNKQLVDPSYILQLSDAELDGIESSNPSGRVGIEDLVPLELAVAAAREYCAEFTPDISLDESFTPSADTIYSDGRDTQKGVEAAIRAHAADEEFHLDKIGFARSLMAVLGSRDREDPAVALMGKNFMLLLSALAKRQRLADREASSERIRSRINRVRKRFTADHPDRARREDVLVLAEEIEGQLDSSVEAEDVRASMRAWIREFDLEADPRADLERYSEFLQQLDGLAYVGARSVQVSQG